MLKATRTTMAALIAVAVAAPAVAQPAAARAARMEAKASLDAAAEAAFQLPAWIPGRVEMIESRDLLGEGYESAWSGWLSNNVRVHAVPMGAASRSSALQVVLVLDDAGWRERLMAEAALAMLTEMAVGDNAQADLLRAHGWRFEARAHQGALVLSLTGGDSIEAGAKAIALMLARPDWTDAGLTRWRERQRALRAADVSETGSAINDLLGELVGEPSWPASFDPGTLRVPAIEAWLAGAANTAPMSVAAAGDIDRAASLESLGRWLGGLGRSAAASTGFAAGGEAGVGLIGAPMTGRERIEPKRRGPWPLAREGHTARRAVPASTEAIVLRGIAGPPTTQLAQARRLRHAMGLLELSAREALLAEGIRPRDLAPGMLFGDREGGRSLVWVFVSVAPSDASAAERALDGAFAQVAAHGLTAQALERSKSKTKSELVQLKANAAYWADRLTVSDAHGLPADGPDALAEAYGSISLEEVNAVLRSCSGPEHRVLLSVGPPGEPGMTAPGDASGR